MEKVLILGLGVSGIQAAIFLKNLGFEIYYYDEKVTQAPFKKVSFANLKKEKPFFKMIIKSPGIKANSKIVSFCRLLTFDFLNDIELFYRYLNKKVQIIAVTGTNGKTTLVNFLYELFKKFQEDVFMVGNIGVSPFTYFDLIRDGSILIFELSSFQIEDLKLFHAHVVCLTNIYKNHLDVNPFYYYIAAKKRLLRRLKEKDSVFFKEEAKLLVDDEVQGKLIDIYDSNNNYIICDNMLFYKKRYLLNLENINLKSKHDIEHMLLGLHVLDLYYFDEDKIISAIKELKTINYRQQVLGKFENFFVINDAKSSNVEATKSAIKTFNDKIRVIILGGISKSGTFKLDIKEEDRIYCYGKDGLKIAKENNYFYFETLKEVLLEIKQKIKYECYLIFTPGCSSFDQFDNYIQRGKYFKDTIEELFK